MSVYTEVESKAATYIIKVSGWQGTYTANTQYITFSVVIDNPCPTMAIDYVITPSPHYYVIFDPANTFEFTYTPSLTFCGT